MKENEKPVYSLRQLLLYFLKLGATGFGGPIALIGYMHRDLVEGRKWIGENDYRDGIALAELAPGPLAAQTAMYLGYVHYRIIGATLAGLAFILPSFLMVVGLGIAYKAYGGLAWMQAVFYGVSASIVGIILVSAYRLTRKTIARDWLLWFIYGVAALFTVISESEQVMVFLAAGVLAWLVKAPPKMPQRQGRNRTWLIALPPIWAAAQQVAVNTQSLWTLFAFFAKAGAFVFGSGLAIVPFLYGGVVKQYHWLSDREFIDAVAVAMITPGPVVITVGFIGFLVSGLPGAVVAALGTFLPCYLFTVIPAPYFKKHGKRADVAAFVNGVTAAAIGAISGAAVILIRKTIVDEITAAVAIGSVVLLVRTKKIPEPMIVLIAALVGLVAKSWASR